MSNIPGSTFYSAIDQMVASQIKVRENITSSNTKTAEELAVLNQNSGWVRVVSGCNVISSKDQTKNFSGPSQRFILLGGSSISAAQANLLTQQGAGGTAFDDGSNTNQSRSGINFDPKVSFPKSMKAYNNYNNTYGLGIRPMPGITSFSLSTYNTFGTLRLADISFVVWTLDDLEQAEKLFLRPGFSVIVEFGHSVFFTNPKEGSSPTLNTIGNNFQPLADTNLFRTTSIYNVETKIQALREKSNGNYDGFFGFVTNFSYSYRPDGGYDCTIKVSSKGVILDGLATGESTDSARIPEPTYTGAGPELAPDIIVDDNTDAKHMSIFHTIFRTISEFIPNFESDNAEDRKPTFKTILEKTEDTPQAVKLAVELDTVDKCQIVYARVTDPVINQEDNKETVATEYLSYIPLKFVLDIINKYCGIYRIKDTERAVGLLQFNTIGGNLFRTFKKHFSTAPSNVHLPKKAPELTIKLLGSDLPDNTKFGMTADAADVAMGDYGTNNPPDDIPNGENEILNIFLSTKILLSIADQVYDSPDIKDLTLIDFINGVLKTINTSLSNVCNLTLYYNEVYGEFEVVDAYGSNKVANITEINLTGLKSTVKDLSISSRLSSQTAAQVSIAAQGSVGNYKENVRAIRQWNAGSIDRFFPTKTTNPNNNKVTPQENIGTNLVLLPYADKPQEVDDLTKFFKTHPKLAADIKTFFHGLLSGELDTLKEKNLQQSLRQVNLLLYEMAMNNKDAEKNSTVTHEIPIPVELSFTMKGISGFKIGQIFKIKPGVLLKKYNKYGYVITGIDNKVDNNEWTTEVSAQFFELDNL